ncbi:DUF2779 domain-containing protein [uncultured Novosphingobium sp.]|uniref:DUF2779 domain-containing protein n=1 Tax=uncultured Novosphingobium sp. TaxID=292277 RepID=UPI002593BC75|nr:DUF2779 domain-containing protein [uncultured Novosphingobium sp.]
MPATSPFTSHDLDTLAVCPRRLWLERNIQAETTQAAFVGHPERDPILHAALAENPEGQRICNGPDLQAAVNETNRHLAHTNHRPLFNACFVAAGPANAAAKDPAPRITVTADILLPAGEDSWILVEVLPALRIRERSLERVAHKVWVLERCGLEIAGTIIRTINPEFVLERPGEYRGLFSDHHVLGRVRHLVNEVPGILETAQAVVKDPEPELPLGPHCTNPAPCRFLPHCTTRAPGPQWPVTILPDGGWKKWKRKGYDDLLALDEQEMKPREAMIVAATRSGRPFHDLEGAREAIGQWTYPRAWIDFEAASPALPRWIGTQPFQQVPFQFSLHLEQADGSISNQEYLCCDGSDPRKGCAQALVAAVPANATLIAYNAGFERSVLRRLARDVPDYAEPMLSMAERTVDLQPVARNCWYHPAQRGSWSIKAILPSVADLDYDRLEIKGGAMAQDRFLEAIDPSTPRERRQEIEEALRAYCRQDTWAMILLARRLTAAG